jgi:IS5 family transposase
LKLPQRLFLLETKVQAGDIMAEPAKEYEAVHVASLQCKANTAQKCRKMKMGGVDWSPEYQQSRDAIELWALLRRKKRGLKVSSPRLRRWIWKTKGVNPWGRSLAQIEGELQIARINYRAAERRHQNSRRLIMIASMRQWPLSKVLPPCSCKRN